MGTELITVSVKGENDDIPPVPPGFESYASFTLKKVQGSEHDETRNITCSPASSRTSEARSVQKEEKETESDMNDSAKITRSLRRRPWINYGQYDDCLQDESDSSKHDQNYKPYPSLPKGVIRGCPECADCQKVTARWKPGDSHMPELEDAPVFYPTEEEFEDTLTYISSIRPKAELYGICRIVPPSSWRPVCPLKDQNIWGKSKFTTRVQRVDKLQNRTSMRKMSKFHNNMRRKRRKCTKMTVDCGADGGSVSGSGDTVDCEAETFGFEPGPEFTLNKFQMYADDFKAQYFARMETVSDIGGKIYVVQEHCEPSTEEIEGEYWRIVEKATEEIEVLYGADLETGVFGSGFPKKFNSGGSALDEKYIKSGWNLNNFPRLPGSVLSYESSDISGVLVPWLYIGMCLSSFCWHVEDHHLYSLNYMHWGAPKMWYGVPGKDAPKFEEVMRKYLPDLFEEQPDLLHKLVTQLSPSVLKNEGVPVYRCIQNAGEFVLTFPRAYHSGFNCGFNCAEAVNAAPVDWLPHGQHAIELYREQGRKTSISHDKLLLGAAREAVKAHWELNLLRNDTYSNLRWKNVCGQDGLLAKTLKMRVEMERVRREFLCKSSKALKMLTSFDATNERECTVCFFDLHLSAAGCRCSPDRYACLNHAKQFCPCPWSAKYFLFRYDIGELDILVEALEGKLSAIYRWARLDLGLALSSYVSKDNSPGGRSSNSIEGTLMNEETLKSSSISSREPQGGELSKEKSLVSSGSLATGIRKPSETAVASKDLKAPLDCNVAYPVIDLENPNSKPMKLEYACSASSSKVRLRLFSHELLSNSLDPPAKEHGANKPSSGGQDNIILLSDDENDEPEDSSLEIVNKNSSKEHPKEIKLELQSRDEEIPHLHKVDQSLAVIQTDAEVINQKNNDLSSKLEKDSSLNLVQVKNEHDQTGSTHCVSDIPNVTRTMSSNAGKVGIHMAIAENDCVNPQTHGTDSRKTDAEDSHEKVAVNGAVNPVDGTRTNLGTPSCSQSNMDRNFRQKGPRIAKVVRRISCNVEPLEYGAVLSGKAWCSTHVIFPKGFRSRVRYISILDPSNMAYYVSEILDAGKDRPLFMVHLEDCPSEVFVHVSAARSWEMVRERVNQEITKQHRQGQKNLPPLQPPGSLDGFEMFGFSSPAIVQAIEALDRNRVCTEYWEARPYSRPQVQIPQNFQPLKNSVNLGKIPEEGTAKRIPDSNLLLLRSLFKKANPEELNSLCSVLGENNKSIDFGAVTHFLNEEIRSRSR